MTRGLQQDCKRLRIYIPKPTLVCHMYSVNVVTFDLGIILGDLVPRRLGVRLVERSEASGEE